MIKQNDKRGLAQNRKISEVQNNVKLDRKFL